MRMPSGHNAKSAAAAPPFQTERSSLFDRLPEVSAGVRTIIDDENLYDQLKLFARFVRLAGYGGFLVCLDELVNLYKLANSQARTSNYVSSLIMLRSNACLEFRFT